MHRRSEVRVIAAFYNTCWFTSEPAQSSVSSLPWKPTPYYSTCMHTEGAIAMASSTVATRSFQRADRFTQQLTGHSLIALSITMCFTHSWGRRITFYISRRQGLVVLSRNGSYSSGDRKKEALQGSQEMPKDAAEPALHARIRRHYHHQQEQQWQQQIGRGGE